jgi:hypothetical protein
MGMDPKVDAIVRFYIELSAAIYAAVLPRPATTFFGDSLVKSFLGDDGSLLKALQGPDAPRPTPAPVIEAPPLDEGKERMLDDLGLSSEERRQVREAFASGVIERAADPDSVRRRLALLEGQFDDVTVDLISNASTRACIRAAYHTLPVVDERKERIRYVTRWIELSFAGFFADLMAALAKPGDLQSRRLFLPAIRAFRSASDLLLPGDRAIFATYHRDDVGFVRVAAVRKVTRDEERARYEGFLERLAAAMEVVEVEDQRPAKLVEVQEGLAWLAEWVGKPDERVVH